MLATVLIVRWSLTAQTADSQTAGVMTLRCLLHENPREALREVTGAPRVCSKAFFSRLLLFGKYQELELPRVQSLHVFAICVF